MPPSLGAPLATVWEAGPTSMAIVPAAARGGRAGASSPTVATSDGAGSMPFIPDRGKEAGLASPAAHGAGKIGSYPSSAEAGGRGAAPPASSRLPIPAARDKGSGYRVGGHSSSGSGSGSAGGASQGAAGDTEVVSHITAPDLSGTLVTVPKPAAELPAERSAGTAPAGPALKDLTDGACPIDGAVSTDGATFCFPKVPDALRELDELVAIGKQRW